MGSGSMVSICNFWRDPLCIYGCRGVVRGGSLGVDPNDSGSLNRDNDCSKGSAVSREFLGESQGKVDYLLTGLARE